MTEKGLRTDSSKYNAGTLGKQLIHEQLNSAMNWHGIVERIKKGTARDVAAEKKVDKVPAFVIGSGPSLDHSIKHLKDWEGGIFCSTSHALSLMRHGIEPTHIVALDPFCTFDEIKGVDWSKTRTKLIAHPGVWPDLIENWPNDILLYIESLGDPNSYYATTQKRMYTHRTPDEKGSYRDSLFTYYIPTEITLFACSPPIQMFLADLLGYGNIFLAGIDFAFHETKERFTNYTVSGTGLNGEYLWEAHEHPFIEADHKNLITTNNGMKTEEIHLYYLKNFMTAWRLSHQQLYTTDHGALTQVPYVDIEKVIQKKGLNFPAQSNRFIEETTEKYLASVGAFVIETDAGVSFVEAHEPTKDLPEFMNNIFKAYTCQHCGVALQASDVIDHAGDECPQCKKENALKHTHAIDREGQIKKFMKYLAISGTETKLEDWGVSA